MTTHEGPRLGNRGPRKIDDSPRTSTKAEGTSRARRVRELRAAGQTWEHFRRLGLTSETVRDTLQEIMREAA